MELIINFLKITLVEKQSHIFTKIMGVLKLSAAAVSGIIFFLQNKSKFTQIRALLDTFLRTVKPILNVMALFLIV